LATHIPSEDATVPGADSVIKLVQDDSGVYDHDGPSSDGGGKGLEGLTAQELYWPQVEEEEDPGAWEREMELVAEMANGKWKDGADPDGAFLLDGRSMKTRRWMGRRPPCPRPRRRWARGASA
jgi:hypothetical protein